VHVLAVGGTASGHVHRRLLERAHAADARGWNPDARRPCGGAVHRPDRAHSHSRPRGGAPGCSWRAGCAKGGATMTLQPTLCCMLLVAPAAYAQDEMLPDIAAPHSSVEAADAGRAGSRRAATRKVITEDQHEAAARVAAERQKKADTERAKN